ncbi:MAG: acyl-CoA dehydrogenase [Acidobacteria bacterium]|nr:acyl-CoA dehydrogenase [Acidobacteriota bacterium]
MSAYTSPWMNDDLAIFRKSVRQFLRAEFLPHEDRWRAQHHIDREAWLKAGQAGFLLADVPEEYGGGGGTFAYTAVVLEELGYAPVTSFGCSVQEIVAHYVLAYGSETQRRAWLPRMAAGEMVGAIGMTEPGAGSDLQGIKTTARREGDHYVIDGSKTFITNGWHADLICLAVKTDPAQRGARAISLIMVETKDLAGYRVGRTLEKIGQHGQDTCELFFDGVRVPAANLLGSIEGQGFAQMMEQLPYERLLIAVSAVATMELAVDITTQYAKDRKLFGGTLMNLQHTRFALAECKTEAHIGRVFLDSCIERLMAGTLDTATASMAKWWLTDKQCAIADACLQLHGGYGYMVEYPIARIWADSRVQRIYAGANEIMKELVARSL